ncbi:acyl-CoA dehydrogenase family protein [Mycobacterium montefiorense]|uniref:acyl-CoA dehydrogenase family protein n=1 Tax=Mycobacterium montefiorense TaxID=154654 RepID=UPI0021F272F4|nr:acyl-CoA dehydrogenase family protein [Mycobacterium montefiorense]MCV7427646.1 acyl-CoA dehydrogenase family protein [Mycobacterium montefiorense]
MTSTSAQCPTAHEELLASAVRLQPLLRESTLASEATRRLPNEAIDALAEAGFFRLLKPARFGGLEAQQRTVLEIAETLGHANASAAWLVSIGAGAAIVARHGSEQAQSEIFSAPDARIAGGLAPGRARRVAGGFSISGSWSYASGAPHADWASIGVLVPDQDERDMETFLCFVPASEVRLRDTWHTVGMRGTASQTLLAEDVFVPEHRAIAFGTLLNGRTPADESEHQLPLVPAAALLLVGPLLGIGQAAADLVLSTATSKPLTNTSFTHQSDSAGVQIQVAEAELKLRTARLHAFEVADALDAGEIVNGEAGYPLRAQARAQCAYAASQVLEAIQTLINVHGAGSFADSSAMQQYWRDANVAARHAALNSYVGYEIYGKSLLGVLERIAPLV